MEVCEICGQEFSNLGAHMYQKHREAYDAQSYIMLPITPGHIDWHKRVELHGQLNRKVDNMNKEFAAKEKPPSR